MLLSFNCLNSGGRYVYEMLCCSSLVRGLSTDTIEVSLDQLFLLLCCSFMMEYDIHTVLDFLTLVATVWVIYTLRIPLKDTYQEEQDSVQTYYVVGYLILCQSWERV